MGIFITDMFHYCNINSNNNRLIKDRNVLIMFFIIAKKKKIEVKCQLSCSATIASAQITMLRRSLEIFYKLHIYIKKC